MAKTHDQQHYLFFLSGFSSFSGIWIHINPQYPTLKRNISSSQSIKWTLLKHHFQPVQLDFWCWILSHHVTSTGQVQPRHKVPQQSLQSLKAENHCRLTETVAAENKLGDKQKDTNSSKWTVSHKWIINLVQTCIFKVHKTCYLNITGQRIHVLSYLLSLRMTTSLVVMVPFFLRHEFTSFKHIIIAGLSSR